MSIEETLDTLKPDTVVMQDAIQNALFAARWKYPELQHLTLDEYASHAQRLKASVSDLELHGSDLYLTLACGRHDQDAIRLLDQTHRVQLETHLVQSGFDAATRQDVFQQLFLHLCTGDSPRILTYAGKASLATWLKVVVLRFAINMTPRAHADGSDATELALARLVADERSPELKLTVEVAKPLFQAALARAMSRLTDRDATILRLFFVDGLSNEGIGRLYGVHRATSARWITEIRQHILEDVQNTLSTDFGVQRSEFESLALLVRSELHLSLRRVLGAA